MPVYVYRCDGCGQQFEKRQSFSDAPLTECELCHGSLRKLLQPTTIIYKGSGFYSTDHRSKSGGDSSNGSSKKKDGATSGTGSAPPDGSADGSKAAEGSKATSAAASDR